MQQTQQTHVHPESLIALSFSSSSVRQAAQSEQEERVNYYCLVSLLIQLSQQTEYGTQMPENIRKLLAGR